MLKFKKTIYTILQIFKTVTTSINRLITREFLIFSSLLSFTFFLITLGTTYLKSSGDAMTAAGLFFTFVFSIWQFIEDRKEKNYQNILNVEESINSRVDFVVTQFTKALDEVRNRSEREDESHTNKINILENKILNAINELKNTKDQLIYHLNSFGHTKTIQQQQEMIKEVAEIWALIELNSSYSSLARDIKELAQKVSVLENKNILDK